MRRRRFGLRARATVATATAAMIVSVALSVTSYLALRSYLLHQRVNVVQRQTFANARVIRDTLRDPGSEVDQLLESVRTETGTVVLLNFRDRWYAPTLGRGPETLPAALQEKLASGVTAYQYYREGSTPRLAMGIPMPAVGAIYVESYSLKSLQSTLGVLRLALFAGAAVTTLGAALLGFWASRTVLRPLTTFSSAASSLAAGGLDVRLPPEPDPDLDNLAHAFNEMADALQERILREARFASDVSHELRTPLTALQAAMDVLERRRGDLGERGRDALDIALVKTRQFHRLMLDLLEITRMDAGADDVRPEPVDLGDFVRRIAERQGFDGLPIAVSDQLRQPVLCDRRHLERIVSNLVENAHVHGEGPVGIQLLGRPPAVTIFVDDAGPGIPADERAGIFDRFTRGTGASSRPGSGLGLAIVAEHARRLGGGVEVTDRPGGGARFVVNVPVEVVT